MAHDLKVGDLVVVDHRYLGEHSIRRDEEFDLPTKVTAAGHGWIQLSGKRFGNSTFYDWQPGFPTKFNPIEPLCEEADAADEVEQPAHYKIELRGETFDAWEIIEAVAQDDYHLASVLKYLLRCKKKGKFLQDLKKARAHLNRRIDREQA